MLAVLHSLGMFIVDLFKPRPRLEAENLFLRVAGTEPEACKAASDAARKANLIE